MHNDKQRTNTRIAVYLIGTRGKEVLLAKRKNTGHMDGCWSLVAGHVYEGESSTDALLREALEECGLTLKPDELQLMGAMHHCSPPYDYINFIFKVDLHAHAPENKEEHKCEVLAFHHIDALPSPIEPYIREIITQCMQHEVWVAEYGWPL